MVSIKSMLSLWTVFGVICFIIGVSLTLSHIISHITCKTQTEGIVFIISDKIMGQDIPRAKLTYTVNGVVYTKDYANNDVKDGFNIAGRKVTIFYNPSNPEKYYILEEKSTVRLLGIVFTIAGVIFILAGYGLARGWFTQTFRGP